MEFQKFVEDYRRWRWVPRTSGEAFRDANYAAAVEIYVPRNTWLAGVWQAIVGVVLAVGLGVVALGIVRGVFN